MMLATADGAYTAMSLNPVTDGIGSSFGAGVQLLDHLSGRQLWRAYDAVYRGNPWAYSAIRNRARDLGGLSMIVKRRGDLVDEHDRNAAGELVRALRRPIGRVGMSTRWLGTAIDKHVWGNALWEIVEDPFGRLHGFRRVPWSMVEVHEELGRESVWYVDHSDPLNPRTLWPWQVVHFGLSIDPSRVCESSAFESLSATLRLHDAVSRQVSTFFENGARPSAHVQVGENSSKAQIDLVREIISEYHAGVDNAGRVLVTTGKFDALTSEPAQSEAIALANQSRNEILTAFDRPPPLAGVLESGARANVVELHRYYLRQVVGGDATMLEEQLFEQLQFYRPALSETFGKFDLDTATRAPFEERVEALDKSTSTYTPNERRALEGLEPLATEFADTIFVPLNHVPIDQAGGSGPQPDVEPEQLQLEVDP